MSLTILKLNQSAGEAVHDALDLVGVEDWETAQQWTTAAMVRYRSRRTFMEIITHPDTVDRHEFKIAALDKTYVLLIWTNDEANIRLTLADSGQYPRPVHGSYNAHVCR